MAIAPEATAAPGGYCCGFWPLPLRSAAPLRSASPLVRGTAASTSAVITAACGSAGTARGTVATSTPHSRAPVASPISTPNLRPLCFLSCPGLASELTRPGQGAGEERGGQVGDAHLIDRGRLHAHRRRGDREQHELLPPGRPGAGGLPPGGEPGQQHELGEQRPADVDGQQAVPVRLVRLAVAVDLEAV